MNKRSLLAGPYIVWIIGFTVLPLLMIIFYALGDGRGEMTMSNILAIFEPVHLKALLLALWLAILCTGICLVLAYPLALILRKLNIGKQGMMAIIVILPMWVNFILRIMAWQLLLSRNSIDQRSPGGNRASGTGSGKFRVWPSSSAWCMTICRL